MSSHIGEVLAALGTCFDSLGVRWYLFGAQAAIFHGVARLTADVDITVLPELHLKRFGSVRRALRLRARIRPEEAHAVADGVDAASALGWRAAIHGHANELRLRYADSSAGLWSLQAAEPR